MMHKDNKGRELNPFICNSEIFANELNRNFDWFSGVPDSVIKNTQKYLNNFYFSSRENHSIGMAFGALLGGKKPCVLIQNSGIGLIIDSLFGLFQLYDKGLVMIISNRGTLKWEEVQHKEWGYKTKHLLEVLDVQNIQFEEEGLDSIRLAEEIAYKKNKIVSILVERGNLDE